MNKLTLVVNAGRSGSTFLEGILRANYAEVCYIAHEDIPVQISKPRKYNRAYSQERIHLILKDPEILKYLKYWEKQLETKPVIETGWTAYHLCPVLEYYFKERFQVIIMHRDPLSFAFSRANMGNYHNNTFYDNAHEVSPFDEFSIFPEKKSQWHTMNHFEKCMFWWTVVYKEGLEFIQKKNLTPHLLVKSKDVFSFKETESLLSFMGLNPEILKIKEVSRNELALFMRETFPVQEEWKEYIKHEDVLKFAQQLGEYNYVFDDVEKMSLKYKLPNGVISNLRFRFKYWKIKAKLKSYFCEYK